MSALYIVCLIVCFHTYVQVINNKNRRNKVLAVPAFCALLGG